MMHDTHADALLVITLLAIVAAVIPHSGCVRGDLNVYYGGRQVARVSNVAHTVTADIDAAEAATPGWLTLAARKVAGAVGLPEAAGGGLAVVLTGVWMRIRSNRKRAHK